MRVGIIGGGVAGLAAGYELTAGGHYAAVYERAPFLGGQASTFPVGGGLLERGYHHLFTSDVDIIQVMTELGIDKNLRWIESKVGIFYGDRIYNFITPLDLLRFTPLPLIDRVRMGLVTLNLRRYKHWRELEKYTAAEWILKHAGQRVYDVVWGPLLRGKFGSSYSEVGMPWFWGKIQTRFASRGKGMAKEKLGYPIGSWEPIIQGMAQRIRDKGGEVFTSASAKRVVLENGSATGLEVEIPGREPTVEQFSAVIATVPSYIFPRLVSDLPEDYLAKLREIKYLDAILAILVLSRPLSNIYWLNVADRSIPFVGVIEQTNLVSPSYYGGKHIVYISNYLSKESPLYHLDKGALLEEYLPHLKRINPQFDASWIEEYHYHKVDAAQPIITTEYSKKMPDHRTPFKGLYLANTTQVYPEDRGTNYSIRMGRKVARMVLEDLGQTP